MQTKILIALFICHWLADYTYLSTPYMIKAKRFGKPLFPIFIHALVHAILMSIALVCFIGITEKLVYLALFQLITHFLIDTWKGKMNVWFPLLQSPANILHWTVFGFDQLLHTVVIVLMSEFVVC